MPLPWRVHCTSFRYNHSMTTHLIDSNDPVFDASQLAYRVRAGANHQPLIIMIHGLGGDENVTWVFEQVLPKYATVIAPRAPMWIDPNTPFAEEASGGYSWFRPTQLPRPDAPTLTRSIEQLQVFIRKAREKYQANENEVYLLGFSQGAAVSYALSFAMPNEIAGVIALAGFLPELDHMNLPETRVFPKHGYLILHGLEDQRVPIEYARQAVEQMRSIGASVKYHEYPIGHKIPAQGLKDIKHWFDHIHT